MNVSDNSVSTLTQKSPIQLFSKEALLFWLFVSILLIDRIWVLLLFGFRFTSNDDLICWLGAKDYGNGFFHEPFFYGQNYNFLLESIFAAPFVHLGASPQYVFPIVTSFLALIPFFAFGVGALRKGNLPTACLFLAIPILLPVQYDMLTTISRGFVTGIFFLAFYPRISRIENNTLKYFLSGLIFSAAVVTNPNSLPLILFFCALIIMKEFKNRRTFIFAIVGAIPFLLAYYFAKQFYVRHPGALIHEIGSWMLVFRWDLLWQAFGQLDRHFAYLCPAWWSNGSIVLLIILIAIVFLFRIKRQKEAIAFSIVLLVILFSLGFPKIHDAVDSPFFAYSRMFLCVPLLLCFCFAFFSETIRNKKKFAQLLAFVCLIFFSIKLFKTQSVIAAETAHLDKLPVRITLIDQIKSNAKTINDVAQKEKAELIIGIDGRHFFGTLELWLWGGEALDKTFKPTLICNYDRRSWRYLEEMDLVHRTILLVGGKKEAMDNYLSLHPNASQCNQNSLVMYVLHNNQQSTHDLLQELGEMK